jgi:retron-type reverse transcriptase
MNFPRNLFIENAKREGHSDTYLKETLDYIDVLKEKNLPVVFSLMHLSILLGLNFEELKNTIHTRSFHYSYYLIRKRRGGYRRIIAPHQPIKFLQNWIKINILDNINPSHYATGFIKNKSILTNAKLHEDSQVVFNLDLVNFFESITERRIYGIFKSLGYCKNLAVEFAKICTVQISCEIFENLSELESEYFSELLLIKEPVLAQGASTSPGLSNIVCQRLDKRLSGLANKLGVNYSRYADDITFSGDNESLPNIGVIRKIISEEGFNINWDKVGKYKKGQKQVVTGLLVDGHVRVPKKFKKEIYRHLHFCEKYGALSHFQRISPDKGYRKEWLLGKILFVNSIEPDEAKKMYEIAKKVQWEI